MAGYGYGRCGPIGERVFACGSSRSSPWLLPSPVLIKMAGQSKASLPSLPSARLLLFWGQSLCQSFSPSACLPARLQLIHPVTVAATAARFRVQGCHCCRQRNTISYRIGALQVCHCLATVLSPSMLSWRYLVDVKDPTVAFVKSGQVISITLNRLITNSYNNHL